jgi:adenylosuccinate synthase
MALDIIVGAQWGDEGKGRITDLLAANVDYVARFSGGDNAGHTVTIGEEIFKLHLMPSGIIHQSVICIIGNGVVINPAVLLREIKQLEERGISVTPDRLKISTAAHLITPAHIALDKANEAFRGDEAIGTTQRGIGPAYSDKTNRQGLRAGLLAEPENLADAIHDHIAAKNKRLKDKYGADPLDATEIAAQYADYAKWIAPYLANTSLLVNEALEDGRSVLAEGAQGTLLDLDHGTYPFVTSSWPTSGGALIGLGVGPKVVGRVIGVAKAFTTRVGSGPFPCELDGLSAARLRGTGENPWDEYGTTTGRPRRVGWLDLVILKYAGRINGLTEIALTKLDILSGMETLPICVAYDMEGQTIDHFPNSLDKLALCKPVYEILPGWQEDITGARSLADLPRNACRYIEFVSDFLKLPVSIVSVGPKRSQTIFNV